MPKSKQAPRESTRTPESQATKPKEQAQPNRDQQSKNQQDKYQGEKLIGKKRGKKHHEKNPNNQAKSKKTQVAQKPTPQKQSHCPNPSYTVEIGRIGRAIGLQGALALHLTSDFLDFLQEGTVLLADTTQQLLTIESLTTRHGSLLVMFRGIDSREKARELLHARLLTSEQETREKCTLKQGEFFYFDIIGLEVIEEGEVLGCVSDIERIGATDYLLIATESPQHTAQEVAKPQKAKSFLLPYIDAYVRHIQLDTPTQRGGIFTQNAKSLRE